MLCYRDRFRHAGLRFRQATLWQDEAPKAPAVNAGSALLNAQEITLTSAALDPSVVVPREEVDVTPVATPAAPLAEPDLSSEPLNQICEVTADARAVAAAMVSYSMNAPCLENERVTLHHREMVFSALTETDGRLNLMIPALDLDAVIFAAFASSDGAVTKIKVEELTDFDRVVLEWKGVTGFGIHAREYGVDYGISGHVWSEAAGSIAAAVTGSGGFMTPLGNENVGDRLTAQVYTFSTLAAVQTGIVDLSVEAEVTMASFGLEIEARTIQIMHGEPIQSRALTLSVPECDTIDSFLLLNNLLQDLKVAGS